MSGEGRRDEVKEECPFGSVYIQRPATPTQNTLRISVETACRLSSLLVPVLLFITCMVKTSDKLNINLQMYTYILIKGWKRLNIKGRVLNSGKCAHSMKKF